MIQVFIVEDHELVRKGIISILSTSDDLEIIGEFDRPVPAIEKLENGIQPDLIIMDISMPEMSGLEASTIISEKFPSIKIIILSMHKDEEYILQGMNANICGYVVKDSVADEILIAIERVMAGGKFFSGEIINKALGSYKSLKQEKQKKKAVQLTNREREILEYISNGMRSQEMAEKLFISERTVEAHRGNIMKKLEAKNMAEMIKKAMQLGLIDQ